MAKPDPALLDPARYPYSRTIEPRFGDLDVNQHINNVALVGLIEEGRVRFHHHSGYSELHGTVTSMAASLTVEYLGQAFYPDPVEVHCAAARIGRTSHEVYELVTQGGRAVAFARVIIVCVSDGRPAEIPAAYRDSVGPWMLRP